MSNGSPRRDRAARQAKLTSVGRYDTDPKIRQLVWIRAAGHCELCGVDLTRDLRVGTSTQWGEAAHILPASPQGPRAQPGHDATQARLRSNDADNLMLLCPGCHEKIDKDADGYPLQDLTAQHAAHIARVSLAASTPAHRRAVPLLVLSRHFATLNEIRDHDFLQAMSAEGLHATCAPVRVTLPELPADGRRDAAYWRNVADLIHHQLSTRLHRARPESADLLAVVALADIPALIMLGQVIGDRMPRVLFSPNRTTRLQWPAPKSAPPEFLFSAPEEGEGPLALVISLSATISSADVTAALPGARIATFSIATPSIGMVQNRRIIDAFRDALQPYLSALEAQERQAIHLFMAVPASLAIEFGALLTMQHRREYKVYDRGSSGAFELALLLDHSQKQVRP